MATTNGWTTFEAPEAQHAWLGGQHYVVLSMTGPVVWPTITYRAELSTGDSLGEFASEAEAKAACVAHALATSGNATVGDVPDCWRGAPVTRCVG